MQAKICCPPLPESANSAPAAVLAELVTGRTAIITPPKAQGTAMCSRRSPLRWLWMALQTWKIAAAAKGMADRRTTCAGQWVQR